MARTFIFFVVLAACSSAKPVTKAPVRRATAAPLALLNVNLVSLTKGQVLPEHAILIDGSEILAVGPQKSLMIPAGTRRVDANGAFAMAGLADMHVHLRPDYTDWLGLFVLHGVTTVLNLNGTPEHLKLRAKLQRGEILGPTMYTAGPLIQPPLVLNPEQATAEVKRQKLAGYDVVKVYSRLKPNSFVAAMKAARAVGLGVVGHTPSDLPLNKLFAQGYTALAHTEEIAYAEFGRDRPPDAGQANRIAALIKTAPHPFWLITTLGLSQAIAAQWANPKHVRDYLGSRMARLLPGEFRVAWRLGNPYTGRTAKAQPYTKRLHQFNRVIAPVIHKAGGRLVLGTDTPLPTMVPGASLLHEVDLLEDSGLDRLTVLRAATINAGKFVAQHLGKKTERFGRIAPGFRADVVLLGKNPLKDRSALRALQGVVLRGRWIDAPQLLALRKRFAAGAGQKLAANKGTLQRYAGRFSPVGGSGVVVLSAVDGFLVATLPNGSRSVFAQVPGAKLPSFRGLGQSPTRLVYSADLEFVAASLRGGTMRFRRQH